MLIRIEIKKTNWQSNQRQCKTHGKTLDKHSYHQWNNKT